MIPVETVFISAFVFFLTGVMEIVTVPEDSKGIRFARALCAFGYWTFGARITYLGWIDDVSRLHYMSLGALLAICTGRIIICVGILRKA